MTCAALLLALHVYTMHTYQVPQSWNYGAGLECDTASGWAGQVGAYRNSFNDPSVYLVGGHDWRVVGPLGAGLFAGGVTGYKTAVRPVVGARAVYHGGAVDLEADLLPPDAPKSGLTVHFVLDFLVD